LSGGISAWDWKRPGNGLQPDDSHHCGRDRYSDDMFFFLHQSAQLSSLTTDQLRDIFQPNSAGKYIRLAGNSAGLAGYRQANPARYLQSESVR
jgi:hypothetical protein